MSESEDPRAVYEREERGLAWRWAAFVKALAFYPETNSRVEACTAALAGALEEAWDRAEGERVVRVVFGRGRVAVQSAREPVPPGSNLHWLRQRLDRSLLAGVGFREPLDREALVEFCKRVLVHYMRTTPAEDFAEAWPQAYPGLDLLPLRFDGVFEELADDDDDDPLPTPGDVSAGYERSMLEDDRVLLNLLSSNDDVRERLGRIQDRLDTLAPGIAGAAESDVEMARVTRSMDLIGEIVHTLSAEDVQDFERVLRLTTGTLDSIAERLTLSSSAPPASVWSSRGGGDDLRRLMATVGTKLFGREAPSLLRSRAETAEEAGLRAEDTRSDAYVTDDLGAFRRELYALPEGPKGLLSPGELESRPEELGTYLHYFVHLDAPDRAPGLLAGLRRMLDDLDAESADVLAAYVRIACEPGAPGARACLRVPTYLRQNHLTAAMRRCGMMGVDAVCGSFPAEFVPYLASLDLCNERDLAELEEVCRALGPDRITAAAEALTRPGGLAEAGLARGVLEHPRPALMSLARVVLTHGGRALRRDVVRYLRRLPLDTPATGPLTAIERAEDLPDDYLLALLDPPEDGFYPVRLSTYAASLLCRFVDGQAGRATPARLRAIQLLADLPTPEARCLLHGLVTSATIPFLRREPQRVRRVAKRVLKAVS